MAAGARMDYDRDKDDPLYWQMRQENDEFLRPATLVVDPLSKRYLEKQASDPGATDLTRGGAGGGCADPADGLPHPDDHSQVSV